MHTCACPGARYEKNVSQSFASIGQGFPNPLSLLALPLYRSRPAPILLLVTFDESLPPPPTVNSLQFPTISVLTYCSLKRNRKEAIRKKKSRQSSLQLLAPSPPNPITSYVDSFFFTLILIYCGQSIHPMMCCRDRGPLDLTNVITINYFRTHPRIRGESPAYSFRQLQGRRGGPLSQISRNSPGVSHFRHRSYTPLRPQPPPAMIGIPSLFPSALDNLRKRNHST